jgi:microcin C transport system substrate-binding protein
MDIKGRMRLAMQLLKDAGYEVKGGVATGKAGPLQLKIMMRGEGFQRIVEPYAQNLKRVGVVLTSDVKETSVYVRDLESRAFDMTVMSVGQSQSPGNEQLEMWGSKAADEKNTRNYAGVKNKGIDVLIDKIIHAKDRKELEVATRALDRVLYHLHLQVHNWYADSHRVAMWDKFGVTDATRTRLSASKRPARPTSRFKLAHGARCRLTSSSGSSSSFRRSSASCSSTSRSSKWSRVVRWSSG